MQAQATRPGKDEAASNSRYELQAVALLAIGFGMVGLITHDAVPERFVTTATDAVVGVGEIVGGALAPALTGALAHHKGISVIPWIAICATAVALLIVLLAVRERRARPVTSELGTGDRFA